MRQSPRLAISDRSNDSIRAEIAQVEKAGRMAVARFLRELIEAVPCRVHTVPTDNGVQFTSRPSDRRAMTHIFVCV